MARGRKKEPVSGPKRLPNADEVSAAVEEAARQKATAAEYSGLTGQAVKTFTERYGVHRKAFGFVMSLHKMDDQKRQSCLRDAMIMADRPGYFSQRDIFDDLGSQVEEALDDAGIGNDAERKAKTEEELDTPIEAMDTTVSERLSDQEAWDSAGEIAKAKDAARRKASGVADKALTDEIDSAIRPN